MRFASSALVMKLDTTICFMKLEWCPYIYRTEMRFFNRSRRRLSNVIVVRMMQNHILLTSLHQSREYSRAADVIGHLVRD